MDDTWAAWSHKMAEPHGKGTWVSELPTGHYPPRRATRAKHLQCTSCERELITVFQVLNIRGGVLEQLALIMLTTLQPHNIGVQFEALYKSKLTS